MGVPNEIGRGPGQHKDYEHTARTIPLLILSTPPPSGLRNAVRGGGGVGTIAGCCCCETNMNRIPRQRN